MAEKKKAPEKKENVKADVKGKLMTKTEFEKKFGKFPDVSEIIGELIIGEPTSPRCIDCDYFAIEKKWNHFITRKISPICLAQGYRLTLHSYGTQDCRRIFAFQSEPGEVINEEVVA